MVTCEICNKQYKKITDFHVKTHGISLQEYKKLYPNSEMVCKETIKRISEGGKKFFSSLTKQERQDRVKNRVYTEEGKISKGEALRKHIKENKDLYYTKERNEKISIAKTEWWNSKTNEYKTEFIKTKVIPVVIEREGEEFYKRLRQAGIKGYESAIKKGRDKIMNLFEEEMISIIKDKGYECVYQYEINGWFYDCYIPEKNLIVEFDGDYFHPETIEECDTEEKVNRWNIDRKKETIAKENGYNIVRIRQSKKRDIHKII